MKRGPISGAVVALIAAALLTACEGHQTVFIEQRILAMGTWVDIALEAPDQAAADAAIAEVETFLRHYERDFHAWAAGELAEVNAAIRQGRSITVSRELVQLLDRAQRISAASGGLFDPGVGALIELWGFHSALQRRSQPPPSEAIDDLLAAGATIAALDIDGLEVRSRSRALLLDLSGIAKGNAVDEMTARLRRRGITHAMVNAGGDLRVLGMKQGKLWRIGIRDPRAPDVVGALDLGDGEAVFTSGDYERYFDVGGERFHHLLDPRTGRPVTHTRAVTVIAADGVTAGTAATALFVAGPERWRAVAQALGIDAALRVDASGAIETTDSMARRLGAAAAAAAL